MDSNRWKRNLWLAAALSMAAPVWAQNTSTISCSPSPVLAGGTVTCAVGLSLQNGVSADAASIGVTLTPSAGAPVPTANMVALDATGQGFASKSTGVNFASAAWGSGLSPMLTGIAPLATVKFTVPATATGGQTYTLSFNAGQPVAQCCNLGGTGVVPALTAGAPQVIAVTGVLSITGPATPLPAATLGTPYSQTVTTSGGVPALTFTVTGQPAGLNIANTGVLSGTPTASGTFASLLVTVKDSGVPQATASQTFSLTVNAAPSITSPASLASGTLNTAYPNTTVTVTGGTAPFVWSAPALPPGMTISGTTANATIAGTPTSAFLGNVTVTVTDANGASTNKVYPLTINGPLGISTSNLSPLPTATVSTPYSTTIVAGGGTLPYTFAAQNLPAGLSIANTGIISGTPTVSGAFANVIVTVTDNVGTSVSKTYTMTVNPALLISGSNTALPTGTAGVVYSTTVAATGGDGNYKWTTVPALPSGLTIGLNTGIIAGTPTGASNGSITVTVTDGNGVATSKVYTLVINAALSITTASPLPGATLGRVYTAAIATTGGTTPFAWTAPGMPAGLTINPVTGVISGTPTTAGAAINFTVTVTDANGATTNKAFSLTVSVAPTVSLPATLGPATVNSPYPATTVTSAGGTAPIAWSATGLPAGMAIAAATGIISGTPTTNAGSPLTVVVTATDANGATGSITYSLTVFPALVISGPATLPSGTPNVVYTSTTVTATGGLAPYTWSATGLPAGLVINAATGAVTGTPANNLGNPYTVVVTVTDTNLVKSTKTYTMVVNPPLSISGPATLPAATVNVAYALTQVTATGGSGIYTWSATGLPAGLSINAASGLVGGSPSTNAGAPYTVVVTVTDSFNVTATKTYTLAVSALPLSINTTSLPVGVINVPYGPVQIFVQGGQGNYSFAATGLPPGLSLDSSTGVLNGKPTTVTGSPFSVNLTVTDGAGGTVSLTYALPVSGTLTVALPLTLPAATLNSPYTPTTVTAGGGVSPFTWTATGLPAGMAIAIATGIVSGTPTDGSASPYTVIATVKDSTGTTASKTYSLAVNAPFTISAPGTLPVGIATVAYTSTTVTVSGGASPYTFSAAGLPGGMSIAPTTGIISGTPTTNAGTPFTVVVTATDANSVKATKTYTLTINPAPIALPLISSVSNAAGGQTVIAPNTYVSIYGSNFAPVGFTDDWSLAIKGSTGGTILPTSLDGVAVTIGGAAAYVSFVSATQINVLCPSVGQGPLQLFVSTSAGTSAAFTVTAQQYSPAFFPWPANQPVASHLDFTYAVKPGTFTTLTTIAAKPGETIILWGTGFGPTTPAYPFGVAIPPTPTFNTSSNVTVSINSGPATVYQNVATLASPYAGLYLMGVTVPTSLADGDYAVTATINGSTTPLLTLTVRK